jgi:glycosyltransferase involved in cell wall biosynthesis
LELLAFKDKLKLPYRFILYMGTFEPRKNIKAIVRGYTAYRRSRVKIKKDIPVQLILAGSSGWREEEILKEIQASPYKKDIRRIGFVCENDKKKLYNLATVFLYPSLYEGFGMPIIEGQTTGRVVVTSDMSPMKDVAGNGAFLVNPFSIESIREAYQQIINDKDLRIRIIENGKVNAQKYTVETISEQYMKIYKTIKLV